MFRGRAARAKAAVNAPHSKRLAHTRITAIRASVLECASPLALSHRKPETKAE